MNVQTEQARRPVQVRTAQGEWVSALAVTEVEPTHRNGRRIHDFPVIWVEFGGGDQMPWPADAVRPDGAS